MMRGAAWIADYPDGDNFMQLLYGPNSMQSNNACYKSAEFDALYAKSKLLPDGPERNKLYREMTKTMERDTPWIMNDSRYRNTLLQPQIVGYKKHPMCMPTGCTSTSRRAPSNVKRAAGTRDPLPAANSTAPAPTGAGGPERKHLCPIGPRSVRAPIRPRSDRCRYTFRFVVYIAAGSLCGASAFAASPALPTLPLYTGGRGSEDLRHRSRTREEDRRIARGGAARAIRCRTVLHADEPATRRGGERREPWSTY